MLNKCCYGNPISIFSPYHCVHTLTKLVSRPGGVHSSFVFLPAGDSCAQKVPQIHSGNELGALFKEFVFPIYYILCNSTDFKQK